MTTGNLFLGVTGTTHVRLPLFDTGKRRPYLTMITIMAATTKPRITIVSGIASSTITLPAASGLSAMVAAPAAPILDCAQPVAIAPPANAIAAPIATSNANLLHL